MKKRRKRYPSFKYIITDEDILSILNAINNDDFDYILDFFEDLQPVDKEDSENTYSFEQIIANAGIVIKRNK
tara:strand:- start:479 stop:694 length:216 start_codon:yes stop_codon:yes gene_type:complete